METSMQSQLNQEIERRISAAMPRLNQEVQQALTEMSGKPRPKAEADAKLRQGLEREFRDRNRAHSFCDELNKGLQRRHGPNASLRDAQLECERQFRRLLWRDAEARQDELVARLTAGQTNLTGGSHFPNLPGNPPLGWAISNNAGAHDVLVDKNGCPVQRFRLPMDYDGHRGPQLAPGQPFAGPNNVRRDPGTFDLHAFKKGLAAPGAEGNKPYMYLDNDGNVTVGIGHLITDLNAAQGLGFVMAFEGVVTDAEVTAASQAQIEKAYKQLTTRRTEMRDEFNDNTSTFEKYSFIRDEDGRRVQIRLRASAAEIQLDQDVNAAFEQLRRSTTSLPNFDSYPPGAKFTLLDMAFNMGIGNLRTQFLASDREFGPAIGMRNWRLAAEESHRGLISESRNNRARDQLLAAAKQEPFFHDPTCATKPSIDQWCVPGFSG
jgi:GH24 family phage-related lysozyme (muramidase)